MFPSDTNFESKFTLESEKNALPDDPPFHILLLGDWSGRGSRNEEVNQEIPPSKPIEIDRDNFDDVLNSLNVQARLNFQEGSGQSLLLDFEEIEDFHPDNIFQRLPFFSELRLIRKQLVDSNTFENAAREVRSWFLTTDNQVTTSENEHSTAENATQSADLLDQILDFNSANNSPSNSSVGSSPLNSFIKNIVKPHLVQIDVAEQSKLLMIVDEVISDLMRKILHHPQFQSLEAAWKGIYFLTRRVETGSDLKIFLYDLTKDKLINDLKSKNDLTDSTLNKILAKGNSQSWGEKFWAVVGGNYSFSLNIDDVAALIRIGEITKKNQCPFISNIMPNIFGFNSFEESEILDSWKTDEDSTEAKLWNALRTTPEASYLGLLAPRVLGRLPYGEKTDPIERFYFEEFTSFIQHEDYLWFNPMFVFILSLAQTFSKYGFNISEGFIYEVDGLPMYLYQEDNENKTKPCAEINMTQNNFEKMMEQGLMPVASYKNSDKIRLGRFQSVSYPITSLKGRWT